MVDETDRWWERDDALLVALDAALHPDDQPPPGFMQAARAAYAWHNIDAELAALAYDSAVDVAELATMRSEAAPLRALTYEATELTFELEVMADGLAGQLVPAGAGDLQLQLVNGRATDVHTDRNGYFRIRPTPSQPFRLRCRLGDGRVVSTDLISL